ncbi:MAG: pyrimidine dimer DNA glycosylase [Candidatus Dadabacteria bacterium]|nr:pyrimidine dimer DNA glycosylase [Candidatus Dadabacteria bacterium]
MRIWDLPISVLCRNHLLGEHRELHVMWSVITNNKKGWSKHPETERWKGKLKALYLRHEEQVKEMTKRGYNHSSPLDKSKAIGSEIQDVYVDTPKEQIEWIKIKQKISNCKCKIKELES